MARAPKPSQAKAQAEEKKVITGNLRTLQNRATRADSERRAEAKGILDSFATTPSDFSQLLTTTLGGVKRDLTLDDLRTFERHIARHAATYRGGIKLPEVINHSLDIDLKRANEQIEFARAYRYDGAHVVFVTNASVGSPDNQHFVDVEFLDLQTLAAEPVDSDANNARKQYRKLVPNLLQNGKVRFNCDCGRHTFWYRYLASKGGYAYGRLETGYPKVRNPELTGLACKHVLRVAGFLLAGTGFDVLHTAVKKYRAQLTSKTKKIYTVATKTLQNQAKKEAAKSKIKLIRKSAPDQSADVLAAQEQFAALAATLKQAGLSNADIMAAVQRGLMGIS